MSKLTAGRRAAPRCPKVILGCLVAAAILCRTKVMRRMLKRAPVKPSMPAHVAGYCIQDRFQGQQGLASKEGLIREAR